jgi:shikimate dehydrogenase
VKTFAALIGDPVAHSSSPQIMAQLATLIGEDFEYRLIRASEEDLVRTLQELEQTEDCIGLNVTLPHKSRVLEHIEHRASSTERLGATNCLVRGREGQWIAHNTDLEGCKVLLQAAGLELEGADVWVLGAGGAALAAIAALIDLGVCTVHLWNRSLDRAQQVQERFGSKVAIVEGNKVKARPSLILNATSLGLAPQDVGRFEAQFGIAIREALKGELSVPCLDLVYRKSEGAETSFLQWIAPIGGESMGDGKIMLIAQAIGAVNLWFDARLDVTETMDKISL